MKKAIIGSMILLFYVNLVPYVCRVWRGLDWVAQYLPDEGHLVLGLVLFGGFSSLAAVPLIATFLLRKWIPLTFAISIAAVTGLLAFWHCNYDISSDAQSAIGLVLIPIYASLIAGALASIAGLIEILVRNSQRQPEADPAIPADAGGISTEK